MAQAVKTSGAVRAGRKVQISIKELLAWAFQRELASLDFNEVSTEAGQRPGVGIEWIMMQQAKLGVTIDGGGRSDPHSDADIVASALASLPENHGGRRMAIWIAELARAGREPDWMPDARPACTPVEWKRCKHGTFAAREFYTGPGRWPSPVLTGEKDGYACPVTYTDTVADVARAHRAYLGWRSALHELAHNLRTGDPLTGFAVTLELPPVAPWQNRS